MRAPGLGHSGGVGLSSTWFKLVQFSSFGELSHTFSSGASLIDFSRVLYKG